MTTASEPAHAPLSAPLAATDRLLVFAVVVAGFALCVPSLLSMNYLWRDSQFYGHAYALPVVAAYLAYSKLTAAGGIRPQVAPAPLGPLLVFAAASVLVLALMGDVGFVTGIGIPVLLGAVAYALGGRALLSPLLLPLVFLALMVPPPRFLTYQILFQLKLLVTDVAVAVLQATGATVAAEGNQILVPGHTLFVADACSGLTSIVTLLPLACIVAYFLSHGVWRRALVIASVIPLTVLANVFRVIVTVQLVSSHGIEFAQGVLHESFGLVTYVFGTLAVIGVARVTR